jgi:hypothetical protein
MVDWLDILAIYQSLSYLWGVLCQRRPWPEIYIGREKSDQTPVLPIAGFPNLPVLACEADESSRGGGRNIKS